ncbi:hypothetical protein QCE92_13870, partial [Staphylococcus aureus]|nr:hypothetical protein [Staphylococcus aureus]
GENEPDILAMIAASAALTISGVPFMGPIGAARVGYKNGEYQLNPSDSEVLEGELDLVVAATHDAVMMVESEAKELSEEVMLGAVATVQPELAGDFGTLMEWADQVRRLKVRANAETPLDCQTARDFGAEGVGLCRTEHMFFDAARITAVRQMILASDEAGRRAALAKLLPEQRADFTAIFEVMAGLPVTVRLLDPPLHEFLPQQEAE